jgi:hypothetical protein
MNDNNRDIYMHIFNPFMEPQTSITMSHKVFNYILSYTNSIQFTSYFSILYYKF